ncbi:MAG: LacI family DNA-binding transcriptional regulator [Phycisphaeraceae bacterium]
MSSSSPRVPASELPEDGKSGVRKRAKRVSMREVARHSNVSVATVSMVLNNNPRISRATQVRVRRSMDDLGYTPDRVAQSLSSTYTRLIAVLIPPLSHAFADAYFGEIISGIYDRAARLGHKIILEQAKPKFIESGQHVELVERRFVDGMLCLGFIENYEFIQDLVDRDQPVIAVNTQFTDLEVDTVVCDYTAGAEQAMNCLRQLGHQKIGMILGGSRGVTTQDVMAVYRANSEEMGTYDGGLVVDGRYSESGGAEAARQLMDRHPEVTAIFCTNDKMAMGAMHYLHRSGRSVPEDVSVVGFDNLYASQFLNPPLTTVHLPLYDLGDLACERLIQRIRGLREPVSELLPTHLILRESTAMAAKR